MLPNQPGHLPTFLLTVSARSSVHIVVVGRSCVEMVVLAVVLCALLIKIVVAWLCSGKL